MSRCITSHCVQSFAKDGPSVSGMWSTARLIERNQLPAMFLEVAHS
jgi:hypothetical protein